MKEDRELILTPTDEKSFEDYLKTELTFPPVVDIVEKDELFLMTVDMPGINKENIIIKYNNGTLGILGKRNNKSEYKIRYIHRESLSGNYYREFRISDSIDETNITAGYSEGQLTVKLPKHDKIKPRTISVN